MISLSVDVDGVSSEVMKFQLIDRVIECSDEQITAVKNVSAAEEYLGDHFPGFPILPGVMMLEVMVQAARELVSRRSEVAGDSGGPLVVQEVRNVRYGAMVKPGESLVVEVKLRKSDGGVFEFQGQGLNGEQTAVQGRFSLVPLRVATPQPV